MKKIFALMIVFVMCFMCVACGEIGSTSNAEQSSSQSTENNNSTTSTVEEWKQFLKDYDAWADEYLELVKKYKENPADATILTDYTEKAAKVTEWANRAEELKTDLTADEAAEYASELEKIAKKLEEAANLLQ